MDCPIYGKLERVDTLRFCGNSHATQTNILIFFSGDFMGGQPSNRHISRISAECSILKPDGRSFLFSPTLSSRPQQMETTAARNAMKKMAKPGI
jgi:hypothetical protein